MAIVLMAARSCVEFLRDLTAPIRDRVSDTKSQKKLIMTIVCVALLLDNMLYMVIVPIITEYFKPEESILGEKIFYTTQASTLYNQSSFTKKPLHTTFTKPTTPKNPSNEDGLIGILFASKAIVQLMANPFTGTFIDRVGYVIPLTLGLMVMFTSTTLFAFAESYGVLFAARSMQGLGSALADTASLGLIADRFHDEKERSKALGIALAFISFGSLVAPPFGGFLCEYVGREWPFLILAFICFVDAVLLLLVQIPASDELKAKDGNIPVGTPIYKLFMDPYIAIIAVALMIANFPLAFLEPTIAKWMETTMNADKFEIGLVWLPAFIPHVIGVYVTVRLTGKYFRYQWLYGALGLVLIGVSTAAVPTCKSYGILMIPLAFLCFGIALIDTALLPTLAFLVDVRHTSVYGSVYAIADISYSIAYSLGPILAGQTVQVLGYLKMNVGIGIVNMMYSPLLLFLREIYDWKPDKNERLNLLDTETGPVPPQNENLGKHHNPISSEDEEWSTTEDAIHPVLSSNEANDNHLHSNQSIKVNENGKVLQTSVKPRPRPRSSSANSKALKNETSIEKIYDTTEFNSPMPWNKKASNNAYSSVQPPLSMQSSLSKQELRALAESGAEFYNPLFDGPQEATN